MATLHYVYDPYCGWCYAAAPLLAVASALPGLSLELHGGGMLAGTRRRLVTPQWREQVMPHDRRIAQLSGQPFGAAYFDGLLREEGALFDSAPPTIAIRAAQFMGGRGTAMLGQLQRAHFVLGRRISDPAVLRDLAAGLGLEARGFDSASQAYAGAAIEQHFRASARLLAQAGGQGFPTFVLEDRGVLTRIGHADCIGQPDAWLRLLGERLGDAALSA